MAKKPTGIIGPIKVTRLSTGEMSQTHETVNWPNDQKQIENLISDLYIKHLHTQGVEVKKESGGTTDLDYLLTWPDKSKSYLELMEAVIPPVGEIPFGFESQTHNPVSYADSIYQVIEKKTKLYGLTHKWPIDLLIYVTHGQYSPNEAALLVLAKYLQDRQHSFRSVFFMVHIAADLTFLNTILTPDYTISTPPLEELAKRTWISLPSSSAKLVVQIQDSKDK